MSFVCLKNALTYAHVHSRIAVDPEKEPKAVKKPWNKMTKEDWKRLEDYVEPEV